VLTSTARPLASQKLTFDRSMTSRLEPGRSKRRSCSRKTGTLAMSTSPVSSAIVMPPAVQTERPGVGLTVVPEFMAFSDQG
jgi:hypothetical protein